VHAIAVVREGSGPEVLLVHGGASPRSTWTGLGHLARRWQLAFAAGRRAEALAGTVEALAGTVEAVTRSPPTSAHSARWPGS